MNTFALNQQVIEQVVLTLGHFLWQGALLWLVAMLGLAALRKRSARARYRLLLGVFVVVAVAPLVTLGVLKWQVVGHTQAGPEFARLEPLLVPVPAVELEAAAVGDGLTPTGTDGSGHGTRSTAFPPVALPETAAQDAPVASALRALPWREYAPQLVGVYLLGVALMWLRLALALGGARGLRRHARPCIESDLLEALARQVRLLGMQATPAVAWCERVAVPTIVGILKPVILLPPALCAGLTPQQIELLLCHELAHLRRYDHFVNFAQRLVEAFLFFHPAVLHLSHLLRVERELCCDDLVLACGGESTTYAQSLLGTAEMARRQPHAALLLSAAGKPSQLSRRIHRILDVPPPRLRVSRVLLCALMLSFALGIAAVLQVRAEVPAESAAPDIAEVSAEDIPTPKELLAQATEETVPAPAGAGAATTAAVPEHLDGKVRNHLLEIIRESDPWLQQLALKRLVDTNDPATTDVLIELLRLDGIEFSVRNAAVKALGERRDPKAIPMLTAVIRTDMSAADALKNFPQDLVLPFIDAGLEDPYMREYMVSALPHIGTKEALTRLLDTFEKYPSLLEADMKVSRTAPREVAEEVARPALEQGGDRALAAVWLLAMSGEKEIPLVLRELVRDEDPERRRRAVELAYRFSGPEFLALLVDVMKTYPTYDARRRAAETLQGNGYTPATPEEEAAFHTALGNFSFAGTFGPMAAPHLLVALDADDKKIRREAVLAYAQAAGSQAIPRLLELTRDQELGTHAVTGISSIGTPEAVAALISCLRSGNIVVRHNAAERLGHLKAREAVAPLLDAAQDPNFMESAAGALSAIGDPAAIPPLLGLYLERQRADLVPQDFTMHLAQLIQLKGVDRSQGRRSVIQRGPDYITPVTAQLMLDRIQQGLPPEPPSEVILPSVKAPAPADSAQQEPTRPADAPAAAAPPDPSNAPAPETAVEAPAAERLPVPTPEESETAAALAQTTAEPLALLDDSNSWVRKVAVAQLATVSQPFAAKALIKALKDESSEVREAAAQVLTQRPMLDAIPHLVAALQHADADSRGAIAVALAAQDRPKVIPLLQLALADRNLALRQGALVALGKMGGADAARMALEAVAGGKEVVLQVFEVMRRMNHEEVTPVLVEALQKPQADGKLGDGTRDIASAAAYLLGEIGGDAGREALVTAALEPTSAARLAAVDRLRVYETAETTQVLVQLLGDPDFFVRQEAAEILRDRGFRPADPQQQANFVLAARLAENGLIPMTGPSFAAIENAIPFLYQNPPFPEWWNSIQPGEKERRASLLSIVINSLATSGEPRALELLRQVAAVPNANQEHIVKTAAENQGPAATQFLLDYLKSSDAKLRVLSAEALAGRQDKALTSTFLQVLGDADPEVRNAALSWFYSARPREAIEPLAALALGEDATTRKAAVDALRYMGDAAADALEANFPNLAVDAQLQALDSADNYRPSPVLLEAGFKSAVPEVQAKAAKTLRNLVADRPQEDSGKYATLQELALPHLYSLLQEGTVDNQAWTAEVLLNLWPDAAKSAVEDWLQKVGDVPGSLVLENVRKRLRTESKAPGA